jgi:ABC-type branched-subunit amino acid transport system substrate-binding protein
MKKLFISFLLSVVVFSSINAQIPKRYKLAIFTPLYLDSIFDATGNYRPGKVVPKYVGPGLDFYLGAQAALDSLKQRGAPLEVYIKDTRSRQPLAAQLKAADLANLDMMIGQTNMQETRMLADAAKSRKIPFISATLPNDAGVDNNPYFVMLNSSLNIHLEAIYNLLQKNFSNQKITVFTKKGAQEDMVKNILTELSKTATGKHVNLNFLDLGNQVSADRLKLYLDSTQKNIVISGSLQESFATNLVSQLSDLNRTYPTTVIGMPTWENFSFGRSASNLEILYTSPYYYHRNTPLENKLNQEYEAATGGRPSFIYLQGYETTLRFALLLLDTRGDAASSLTRKGNYILTPFDIQPVFKDKNNMTLDYFQNKHIYFVRLMGGSRSLYL